MSIQDEDGMLGELSICRVGKPWWTRSWWDAVSRCRNSGKNFWDGVHQGIGLLVAFVSISVRNSLVGLGGVDGRGWTMIVVEGLDLRG